MHHAQALAALGWHIFPAPVGSKKSFKSAEHSGGRRWGATCDPIEITQDWQRWPNANVGVVCGPLSGIWCLDIDTAEGHDVDGFAAMRDLIAKHGPLPYTVSSRSPSGSVHYYFKYPVDGEPIRNSESRVGPGIDVRGDGGMVIAPPSVKPDGSAYVWDTDPNTTEIAEAPDWLLTLARGASVKPSMPRPAQITPVDTDELEELLTHIDPDANGYGEWMSIVAAIHEVTGGSDEGLAIADAWSQRGDKYEPGEVDSKFRSFTVGTGGYSIGTIANAAKLAGADVAAIGMKYRLASAATMQETYRPAGMSDGSSVQTYDRVTLLIDTLQPDPTGNIPLIIEEAAQLPAGDLTRLIAASKRFGIATTLRDAVKAHRSDMRRADTLAKGLIADVNGIPIPNMENVRRVLTTSDTYAGSFKLNEFDGRVWVNGRQMNDRDYLQITSDMQSDQFPSIGTQAIRDGMESAAMSQTFHPVREYLHRVRWDGNERLRHMFTYYFPCKVHGDIDGHADYIHAAGVKFAVGAVARVMMPGCKVDTMPTLSGEQGLKKSTGVEVLCGKQWYGGDMPNMREKDAKDWLRGKWIAEIAEMSASKGVDVEHVKNFMSTAVDSYRKAYGHTSEDVPRQTVFIGTVNDGEYLADATGGRRFWPLRVVEAVKLPQLQFDRDQLWAEAVHLFNTGHKWWFDQGESAALEHMQDAVRITDIDEERVAEWLRYVQGDVAPHQVALALFPNERGDRALSARIGRYMKALGWEMSHKVHGVRKWTRTPDAEQYVPPN